jgi:hypothetical protein
MSERYEVRVSDQVIMEVQHTEFASIVQTFTVDSDSGIYSQVNPRALAGRMDVVCAAPPRAASRVLHMTFNQLCFAVCVVWLAVAASWMIVHRW